MTVGLSTNRPAKPLGTGSRRFVLGLKVRGGTVDDIVNIHFTERGTAMKTRLIAAITAAAATILVVAGPAAAGATWS